MDSKTKRATQRTRRKHSQLNLFEEASPAHATVEVRQLGRVRDPFWDFKDSPASQGVYGIHPYPAMFHFLVVRELLKRYSKPNATILDPFVGSGVSCVESIVSGRRFFGYDINPLALLVARVRSTPLKEMAVVEQLKKLKNAFAHAKPSPPDFPNIEYWFRPEIIEDLARLESAITRMGEEALSDFFKVAFSETVRRVSNTRYNEFKLLRRKEENSRAVWQTFYDVSLRNAGLLSAFYKEHGQPHGQFKLDALNCTEDLPVNDNSVDTIITSPPYGDSKTTVAYGQFSRLSLRWLGMEEKVDKTSLGAPKMLRIGNLPSAFLYAFLEMIEAQDTKRAREVFDFYFDLHTAICRIAPKVKPGGYVCWVVGNRRVKGHQLPTDVISAEFFAHHSFEHIKTIVRDISNKRMPSENSPSNIPGLKDSTMRNEFIVVMRKS